MYDRAPRVFSTSVCTDEHVGPGSYDPVTVNAKKIRADGYAPFLSMTGRESFLNPNDNVIAAPGPGQYDPELPQEGIKGRGSLATKAKRFADPASDTPGPGSYTLSKKIDWIKETARESSSAPSSLDLNKQKSNGVLVLNKVMYQRKPLAPSIPSPGQAYGFEENDDGTLRKQDAPDKDVSIGPAYYSILHEPPSPTKMYKGIHFGRLASKRMTFGGQGGPGPGHYDPDKKKLNRLDHANMDVGDRKPEEAKLPRYHELVVMQEEKKAVPGPGKYDVSGLFDPKPPKVNTEGIEIEHPPFGSQSKRFRDPRISNPAPGTYNDPRTALESMKKISGLKRSPFGQTSLRFHDDHRMKRTPGPGTYNLQGMGAEVMRKAYIESTRKGVFGTTEVRTKPITKREEGHLPGPAHYQVKEKPFQARYQQPSSNFASLSNRLAEQPTVVKEIPPVGSYEVGKSFQKSQGKHAPTVVRTEFGKKRPGAFLSSASRFAPPRDIVLAESDPCNPGPGTYVVVQPGHHGNPIVSKDTRFKATKQDDVPGPGAYEFSPLIQDTVLKGTFNSTLNNPILQHSHGMDPDASPSQPFLLGV